jgi:hypothetical protein
MAHDPAHEELLQALLAGDLAPGAAAARELLENCAECARRWRELEKLAGAIDSVDRERREVLKAASVARSVPGSDLVAATLERARRDTLGGAAQKPARASTWKVALLAAALLVIGFFVGRALVPSDGDRADTYLGHTAIELRGEIQELSPGTPIRWHYAAGKDRGPFRVMVRDETGQYAREFPVGTAEWTPTREELRDLPEQVRLRVIVTTSGVNPEELGSSPEITVRVSR